jgi:hypothetical protein
MSCCYCTAVLKSSGLISNSASRAEGVQPALAPPVDGEVFARHGLPGSIRPTIAPPGGLRLRHRPAQVAGRAHIAGGPADGQQALGADPAVGRPDALSDQDGERLGVPGPSLRFGRWSGPALDDPSSDGQALTCSVVPRATPRSPCHRLLRSVDDRLAVPCAGIRAASRSTAGRLGSRRVVLFVREVSRPTGVEPVTFGATMPRRQPPRATSGRPPGTTYRGSILTDTWIAQPRQRSAWTSDGPRPGQSTPTWTTYGRDWT